MTLIVAFSFLAALAAVAVIAIVYCAKLDTQTWDSFGAANRESLRKCPHGDSFDDCPDCRH